MKAGRLLSARKGFSVVEVLIACAIFSVIVIGLSGAFLIFQRSYLFFGEKNRAVFIAEEGLEAARNICDANFSNLADGTYGLSFSGGQWSFSGSSDTQNVYVRNIIISSIDSNTKKIVSNVSWTRKNFGSGNVSLASYLTYWRKPRAINWTRPTTTASVDIAGVQDGWIVNQVDADNVAILRRTGPPYFNIYNIASSAAPLFVSSVAPSPSLNDMHVYGGYAYFASTDNNNEFQVANLANLSSPVMVSNNNFPGTNDANSVIAVGNYAYVGRALSGTANEFFVQDISNPASPTTAGSLNLTAGGISSVAIIGNYAYLAMTGLTAGEIQIVNISNPSSPVLAGSFNLTGTNNCYMIIKYGNYLFVSLSTGRIDILDASNPTALSLVSSFSTGGAAYGMAVSSGGEYLFAGTGNSAGEFQAIDISNISAPFSAALLNLPDILYDVEYISNKDIVIGASANDSGEFVIFKPN